MTFPPTTGTITKANEGLWHDPRYPSQGVLVLANDERYVYYAFTFNTMNDSLRHFHSTGLNTNCLNGETWYSTDGIKLIESGKSRLYFTDDSHGILQWHTDKDSIDWRHGISAYRLEPLILTNHPLNGCWVDVDYPGTGFVAFFYQFHGQERCSLFWFRDGKKPVDGPKLFSKEIETQRWFVLNGVLSGDHYAGNVLESIDGEWMGYHKADEENIGTFVLDVLTMQLRVNGELRNLTRLF